MMFLKTHQLTTYRFISPTPCIGTLLVTLGVARLVRTLARVPGTDVHLGQFAE
jgi:hypothetical protein